MAESMERTLGQLEASIRALQDTMSQMLRAQEITGRESGEHRRRMYEKFDEHVRAVYQRLDQHVKDQNDAEQRNEHAIREIHERIGALEKGMDAIESHGAGLLDHEKRVAKLEDEQRMHAAKAAVNRRWVRVGLGVLAATEGGHLSDWKILKLFKALFG